MTRRGTDLATRQAVNLVLTTLAVLVIATIVSPQGMGIIIWWLTCTPIGVNVAAITAVTLITWIAWPYLLDPLDRDDR